MSRSKINLAVGCCSSTVTNVARIFSEEQVMLKCERKP